MKLSSAAFEDEGQIPSKYTCDGGNVNPPLTISEQPPKTQSLVIIMDDPDVPKELRADGVWDHWIVFNMPADFLGDAYDLNRRKLLFNNQIHCRGIISSW